MTLRVEEVAVRRGDHARRTHRGAVAARRVHFMWPLAGLVLVIEHDLLLLRSIADRMIALDLGRLVTQGESFEVIEHPAVVASYLGTDTTAIARSGTRIPG